MAELFRLVNYYNLPNEPLAMGEQQNGTWIRAANMVILPKERGNFDEKKGGQPILIYFDEQVSEMTRFHRTSYLRMWESD